MVQFVSSCGTTQRDAGPAEELLLAVLEQRADLDEVGQADVVDPHPDLVRLQSPAGHADHAAGRLLPVELRSGRIGLAQLDLVVVAVQEAGVDGVDEVLVHLQPVAGMVQRERTSVSPGVRKVS
jgi:hypothetical protein